MSGKDFKQPARGKCVTMHFTKYSLLWKEASTFNTQHLSNIQDKIHAKYGQAMWCTWASTICFRLRYACDFIDYLTAKAILSIRLIVTPINNIFLQTFEHQTRLISIKNANNFAKDYPSDNRKLGDCEIYCI
jgi:hypothetical protein